MIYINLEKSGKGFRFFHLFLLGAFLDVFKILHFQHFSGIELDTQVNSQRTDPTSGCMGLVHYRDRGHLEFKKHFGTSCGSLWVMYSPKSFAPQEESAK